MPLTLACVSICRYTDPQPYHLCVSPARPCSAVSAEQHDLAHWAAAGTLDAGQQLHPAGQAAAAVVAQRLRTSRIGMLPSIVCASDSMRSLLQRSQVTRMNQDGKAGAPRQPWAAGRCLAPPVARGHFRRVGHELRRRQRGPQSGGSPLPLGARDIVWRAVFSFRARDIERGPWCLLLCAAVIRALLRARRISIVRDGGSRDQHDKGGRNYHRRSPSDRGQPGPAALGVTRTAAQLS
jgi:hypothetical protein